MKITIINSERKEKTYARMELSEFVAQLGDGTFRQQHGQNADFLQVVDYAKMIELTYLSPEETPDDTKPVLLQDIMKRLAEAFPTFTISKGTDMELGRRLAKMGYESKRQTKGSAFRLKEKSS